MAKLVAGLRQNPTRTAAPCKTCLVGLVVSLLVFAAACSSEEPPDGIGPAHGTGASSNGDASTPPCTDGAVRSCTVTVGVQGSVVTCYEGEQTCEDGVWGPCTDGEIVTRNLPQRTLSLGDAGPCANNPCDPSCQVFDEVPDAGVSLDASQSGPVWQVGSGGDLANTNWPGGQYAKGTKEPCYSGQDCQFDQYCKHPLTQATCSHSKCSTGRGLLSTCEECVTKVCAENASCCNTASTTAWSTACIELVGKVCNSRCEKSGTCEHSKCLTGNKLASGCDPCVTSICALRPSCCTGSWDSYCLAMVGSVCNVNCQSGNGSCVQYNPGETNASCTNLPDLTVGVPCGNTVPICNRGSVAVQANTASFWVYPASSSHWQECNPDLSGGTWPKKCPIPNKIDPGSCVSVSCPHLDQLKTVVVNPWSDPNRIAECSCQNNWSLYKKPNGGDPMTCSTPSCAATTAKASIATVNMFITFDKSGSMCEPQASYGCANPGATTRWGLTTTALKAFIRDPKSSGIRVALRFFPGFDAATNTTCGGHCSGWGLNCYTTCGNGHCGIPQVDLGPLLSATLNDPPPNNCASSSDPQECNLVKLINGNFPNGGTPIYDALTGATARMGTYLNTNPLERAVAVLVTDGEATWCGTNSASIAALADSAYTNWGVVTYAVGLASANPALLTDIAAKGRGQAYFLSANNTTTELVTALNAIRNQSVSCDLVLDTTNGVNVNDVTVTYKSGANTTAFTRVMGLANCGVLTNRWYFDNNTSPTKITLCPETCAVVRGDPAAELSLKMGCPVVFAPNTLTQVYSGSCAPSQAVQWSYLTWESSTPSDSYIQFEGRTSNDINTFNTVPAPGTLKQLGTAHGVVSPYTTNTQSCPMIGGPPECPANLFSALGMSSAQQSHLEVRATLYPSTTGSTLAPILNSWKVSYSCVASE